MRTMLQLLLVTLLALGASLAAGCRGAAASRPADPQVIAPASSPAIDLAEVCARFRQRRGLQRAEEAVAIFQSSLLPSRLVHTHGSAAQPGQALSARMTRAEAVALLGPADREDDRSLAYDLSPVPGRHVLHIHLESGLVTGRSLLRFF
jgi:hypothetical protein